jgi:hypothetical protein
MQPRCGYDCPVVQLMWFEASPDSTAASANLRKDRAAMGLLVAHDLYIVALKVEHIGRVVFWALRGQTLVDLLPAFSVVTAD